MVNKDKAKKLQDQLTEDKAKSDASYPYSRNSFEPVAEGAFKGALSSSLASRIARESKALSKFLPKGKTETFLIGTGTGVGAIAGKLYNDKKVDNAEYARKWLLDKRKTNEYIKDTKKIYKSASENPRDQMFGGQDKITPISIAKDTAISGAVGALGGFLFSGLKGLRFGRKFGKLVSFAPNTKAKALISSAKTGSLFGAQSLVPDVLQGGEQKVEQTSNGKKYLSPDAKAAIDGALIFGGSGAVEPALERAIGATILRKKDKDGSLSKEYYDKVRMSNNKKVPVYKKIIPKSVSGYIPFTGKSAEEAENILYGKTMAERGFNPYKSLLKPTLARTSRYAIGGAALMYGLNKLISHLKHKNDIKKTASLSGDDLILAEDENQKEKLNKSRTLSAIKKGGLAGLGFVVGKVLSGGSNKVGAKTAIATLAYSLPKTLFEEYERHKAKQFLSMNRGQKLAEIKKKEDSNKFGASDILEGYIGGRIADNFLPPHKVRYVGGKKKEEKKFNIKNAI